MAPKTHSITKRQRKRKYLRIRDVYRTRTQRIYTLFTRKIQYTQHDKTENNKLIHTS